VGDVGQAGTFCNMQVARMEKKRIQERGHLRIKACKQPREGERRLEVHLQLHTGP
jgi:hypothetical protein